MAKLARDGVIRVIIGGPLVIISFDPGVELPCWLRAVLPWLARC